MHLKKKDCNRFRAGFTARITARHAKRLYQQAIQTAKNMLKDKVDIKLISKYTNLSVEEIKKINEE